MDYVDRLRADWARTAPDLDTSPAEVVARIDRISALVAGHLDAALVGSGLSRTEFDLLCALRRADRPMRASEVSTVTAASGAAITKRGDALERAGLLTRTVPSRDRRGVELALTDAGCRMVDTLMPVRTAVEQEVLADLSEQEAAELARLLSHVLSRVDHTD